jgi:hypothetical protein
VGVGVVPRRAAPPAPSCGHRRQDKWLGAAVQGKKNVEPESRAARKQAGGESNRERWGPAPPRRAGTRLDRARAGSEIACRGRRSVPGWPQGAISGPPVDASRPLGEHAASNNGPAREQGGAGGRLKECKAKPVAWWPRESAAGCRRGGCQLGLAGGGYTPPCGRVIGFYKQQCLSRRGSSQRATRVKTVLRKPYRGQGAGRRCGGAFPPRRAPPVPRHEHSDRI